MSNLLKSFFLVNDENKKIIDSNEAVTARLEEIRRMVMEEGGEGGEFSLGLNPKNVESLLEGTEGNGTVFHGLEKTSEEELKKQAADILEDARKQADNIIKEAEENARNIIQNANSEVESVKNAAFEQGAAEGKAMAEKKLNIERLNLQKSIQDKQEELDRMYCQKVKQLEPELVEVILDVFSDVIRAVSKDQEDMILALVDKVLSGDESSNSYIIKACREDAEFLKANREVLLNRINRDVHIEIVEDVSMKRNECLIDTDLGIYDCGLDIQLENLTKAIRVLSCTNN